MFCGYCCFAVWFVCCLLQFACVIDLCFSRFCFSLLVMLLVADFSAVEFTCVVFCVCCVGFFKFPFYGDFWFNDLVFA